MQRSIRQVDVSFNDGSSMMPATKLYTFPNMLQIFQYAEHIHFKTDSAHRVA